MERWGPSVSVASIPLGAWFAGARIVRSELYLRAGWRGRRCDMRDYAKFSPQFWIGSTGKQLRGNADAQVVALYLVSSPHANMLGLYYLPLAYLTHETGLPPEGASKGLQRCIDVGFCEYDEQAEMVWVVEAARFQIADQLSPNDKQTKGVANELSKLPKTRLAAGFAEKYRAAFHLPDGLVDSLFGAPTMNKKPSPTEAPSKPLRSQEQEQEQEQDSKPSSDDEGSDKPVADHLTPCPHREIIKLYGKHLPMLPHPRVWEGQRMKSLQSRWRWVLTAKKPNGDPQATDTASALEFFDRFFGYVSKSDFLTGRTEKWQGCDLAWLVKAENFAKVIEGKYENRESAE